MGLIEKARTALGTDETRYTVDDYAGWVAQGFAYGGNSYGLGAPVQQTIGGELAERIGSDFVGLATAAQHSNGVTFAVMLVRQLVFSAIRFQYQRLNSGKPSELFGTPALSLLEAPWPGGTTQDLLNRVIQDADLAGNSFNTTETPMARIGGDGGLELVRLRPDWTGIVLGRRQSGLGYAKLGYVYCEGGSGSGNDEVYLLPDEVAHYCPIPDPLASWRGMSWLTPVIREMQADNLMTRHKRKFFENGATPNMVVKHPPAMNAAAVKRFREESAPAHEGVDNAYRTFHIGGGADVTVVGANFQQIEFAVSQGHGETRIAAAGGVPALIVGLSGGMEAAQYANYPPTRRRFADGTMHPLWQNVAGSFAPLLPSQGPGTRLWYDSRDVPFLREDEKDAAAIQQMQAATIASLITAGWEPDSVRRAVMANDYGLLTHSGLYSVQLHPPGTSPPSTGGTAP